MMKTLKTAGRRSDWIFYLTIAALTVLIAFPAVTPGASPPARLATGIRIDNFRFAPATLRVKAGTQITWTNGDDIPHAVVVDGHLFKSKVLDTGERFALTISKPGTYSYFCSIHPNMKGKVVVE